MKEHGLKGILAALVPNVIFGFSFLFSKLALAVTSPFNLLAIRFVLAFALIISDMSYYWRLCGMPSLKVDEVVGVTKAYSSAVGAGPFVCRLEGEEGNELRRRGGDAGEFGATTGRARDVGWFDAVATRYGVMVQGATEVVLTNLDVLGYLDEIPVCVGYEVDGTVITDFPATPTLMRCKPVYEKLPGWKTDIRGVRNYADLPENCRKYVEFIEAQCGVPIRMVSNGPKREEILYR